MARHTLVSVARAALAGAFALVLAGCFSLGGPDPERTVERPPTPPLPSAPTPSLNPAEPPASLLVREGVMVSPPAGFAGQAGDLREDQPIAWFASGDVTAAISIVEMRNESDLFRTLTDQLLEGPTAETSWETGAADPWQVVARWRSVGATADDDAGGAGIADYHAVRRIEGRRALYVWVNGPQEAAARFLSAAAASLAPAPEHISARWLGYTGFSVSDRSIMWVRDLMVDGAASMELWVAPAAASAQHSGELSDMGWNLWIIDADVAGRIAEVDGERRLSRLSVGEELEPGVELGMPLDAREAQTWAVSNYTGPGLMMRWTRASGSVVTLVVVPDEGSVVGSDRRIPAQDIVGWFTTRVAPALLLGEDGP